MQDYIRVSFTFSADDASEILIALLSEAGYEGFTEEEKLLLAYIRENDFNENSLTEIVQTLPPEFDIHYSTEKTENKNWNAEWEAGFKPVIIGDKIYVRATHHAPVEGYELQLVIQPQMSFGTGHHATTSQVMKLMLEEDFKGKTVIDFGCGTGILAILAAKLGAAHVTAIDNDEQCLINTHENLLLNDAPDIKISGNEIKNLQLKADIILANITRNTLLHYMSDIAHALTPEGVVIISGFYEEDLPALMENAAEFSLHLKDKSVEEKWCAATLSH